MTWNIRHVVQSDFHGLFEEAVPFARTIGLESPGYDNVEAGV
jgi:hypothetical protein